MSTNYFRLKKPFTSVRTTVGGGHTQLAIWVNHAKAGDITLRNSEVPSVLQALSQDLPAVRRVATAEGGTRLDFDDDNLESEHVLISEYGDLTCLGDLEAQAVKDLDEADLAAGTTCRNCGEIAVGYDEGSPYCAAHYQSRESLIAAKARRDNG